MAQRFLGSVIAAAVMMLSASAAAQQQEPLKIGFLNTFTGAVSVSGEEQYNGFMLAIEQRGGKLGGVPVQVLKEDDQFKPEVGTQVVQTLIERDGVPIIVGITGRRAAIFPPRSRGAQTRYARVVILSSPLANA